MPYGSGAEKPLWENVSLRCGPFRGYSASMQGLIRTARGDSGGGASRPAEEAIELDV